MSVLDPRETNLSKQKAMLTAQIVKWIVQLRSSYITCLDSFKHPIPIIFYKIT